MNIIIIPFTKYVNNIYFVSVFAFLSIIYFFAGIFVGLDFTDTFYHLNQAENPTDGIILFPILLSSLIIKGLIAFFGPHLIYLRLINALLYIIALLMPFIFLKTGASNIKKLFYIGTVIFLIAPLNANVLGYDTFSIFFNSLIFTISLYYFKKKKVYLIVILAFLCALSILIRLPNAIVLPILVLVIFYEQISLSAKFHLSLIKLPFLFLLLSLSVVFLSYFFYYKAWKVFSNASLGTISHNYKILIYRYLRDGIKLLVFFSFITGTYFLFKKVYHVWGRFFAYGVILLLYVIFIKLYLFPGYPYTIFLTAMVLSIAVIHFHEKSNKHRISDIKILIVFISFLFINAFGSNLGLLKTSFLFLLFPFVLSVINVRSINFWKFIMIVLIPAAAFLKFYKTYEDQNIFNLSRTLNLALLHPIKTSEERFVFLNAVDEKVKQLQDENVSVFFYGNKSHIFHYLYPTTTFEIKAFTQPVENLVFLPQIEDKVMDRPNVAIFLIDTYPEDSGNTENFVEMELMKKGFKKAKEGSIEFLIKLENQNSN